MQQNRRHDKAFKYTSQIKMAAAITHIVLTDKIFDQKFSNLDKKIFVVGTIFPDIRYLVGIGRERTHPKVKGLNEIQKLTSFDAGVYFHQLVDTKREEYMLKNRAYDVVQKSEFIVESIKLLEEEVLYAKVSDWQKYASFFSDVLDQEISYGLKHADIEKWHTFISEYVKQKPNSKKRKSHLHRLKFFKKNIIKINYNVERMRNNKHLINIINNFYDDFEKIINNK